MVRLATTCSNSQVAGTELDFCEAGRFAAFRPICREVFSISSYRKINAVTTRKFVVTVVIHPSGRRCADFQKPAMPAVCANCAFYNATSQLKHIICSPITTDLQVDPPCLSITWVNRLCRNYEWRITMARFSETGEGFRDVEWIRADVSNQLADILVLRQEFDDWRAACCRSQTIVVGLLASIRLRLKAAT